MLKQLMFVVVNGVILNKGCVVVWWYERYYLCNASLDMLNSQLGIIGFFFFFFFVLTLSWLRG
jgi:hypothetical protein